MTLPNKTIVTFDPAVWRQNKTAGLPVTFDAGTPTNLLPNELYFVIGAMYPDSVAYRHELGFWAFDVPCDAPNGTFDYSFGETMIKVLFQDSLYKYDNGKCIFGLTLRPPPEVFGNVPFILADSFMRGAYMVFDTANTEIWIGENVDCGTNVVPIGKGMYSSYIPVII